MSSRPIFSFRQDAWRAFARAFTLIELLVVIAVIAILLSMLLPVIQGAKIRSKAVACFSNMRQLGIGWAMYADENEGFIPQNYMEGTYWAAPPGMPYFYEGIQAWMVCDPWPNYLGNGGTTSCLSGIGHVWPYVRDPKAFLCPGNPRSERWLQRFYGEAPNWGFGIQGRGWLTTYMYRNGMYPMELDPGTSIGVFLMIVTGSKISEARLKNRVMLTDYWYGYPPSTAVPNGATAPHGDGRVVNLLFTDGHARAWKLPDGILPIWGWFGGSSYSEATFGQDFYTQCPWWWVVADRANQ